MPKIFRLLGFVLLLMSVPVLAEAAGGSGATGASSMGVNSAGTTATGPAANFGLNGGPAGGPSTAWRPDPGVNPPPAVAQARRDAIAGAAQVRAPGAAAVK